MATNFQQLQQQAANMRQSLLDQEVLSEDDFVRLEALNINDDPDFIKNLLGAFLRLLRSNLASIEDSLKKEPIDGVTIARMVNGLGVGVGKMKAELDRMRDYCQQNAWESFKARFEVFKEDHAAFKNAIQPYLGLLDRLGYAKATNGFAGDH